MNHAFNIQPSNLRAYREATQEGVDGGRDFRVHSHPVPCLYLHQRVERWRRLALQHALLAASPSSLFVTQRDRLNSAHQVRKRRVQEQILQSVAMRCSYKLYTPFCNCAGSGRILLRSDLINDDDL